jgi:hypothetical protein
MANSGGGNGDNGGGACWGAPQHNAFCSSPSGHSFGSGGSPCLSTPPAPLACCQRRAACSPACPSLAAAAGLISARCCRCHPLVLQAGPPSPLPWRAQCPSSTR